MKFQLKENAAGEMLLTAQHEGETFALLTDTAADMANYLTIARNAASLEPLQDAATLMDEVDEDELPEVVAQWQDATLLADSSGIYREAATTENGREALLIAELSSDALAELALHSDPATIAALVEKYTEPICPEVYASDRSAARRCEALAWNICALMWKKTEPASYTSLRSLVAHCDTVCRAILPGSFLELLAYNEDGDCSFADAEYIQLSTENCAVAETLATWCESVLGRTVNVEIDGARAWYDFPKNVKES